MNQNTEKLINSLYENNALEKSGLLKLLDHYTDNDTRELLAEKARLTREKIYGNKIFIRGLIEFTNYCKNDCYYCGIRKSNKNAIRYRLTEDEILSCCEDGYKAGFRTFVLQGGEDPYYTDEKIVKIIKRIKEEYNDCAVTLSIGEKPFESYKAFKEAGADRYLLRHESADYEHYSKIHPENMTAQTRQKSLYDLKKLGFQVGAGFMVGSPFQTAENIADDLLFMKKLSPEMSGIGPFIPHHDTKFKDYKAGSLELTLFLLSVLRLLLPRLLLASTTALATISPKGRELGMLAGANIVMPNLSPAGIREKYAIYDNKLSTGFESFEAVEELKKEMEKIGLNVVTDRGDYKND